MNFKKLTSLALGLMVSVGALFADAPFRQHRYSSLKATPADDIEVMFVGNSITHMHEWWEAFGSQQAIAGRGNSGGLSSEVLENLESYIDGKPKKLFLMIGTNDISTTGSIEKGNQTVLNIRAILERIQLESPETEIYMQSILPRINQNATLAHCNKLLSELCVELGVNYVDLTDVMDGVKNVGEWSLDGLHPQAKGYSAWTHFIEDKVGYKSVYVDQSQITDATYKHAGLSGSPASRVAQFPYLPINEGDVLIFGDELVHGGEWHELLGSPKVKDRGTGWGTGGITLSPAGIAVIKGTLEDRTTKPAAIIINYGEGGKNAANYRLLIDEAKKHAPDAKIFCMNLPPRQLNNDTNKNADAANATFNNDIVKTAAAEKGVGYIDIYTPLAANRDKYIMNGSYLTGPGYIVVANEIAKALNDPELKPVSEATADALIAQRTIRSTVGNRLTDAIKLRESLDDELKPDFQKAINEAAGMISNTMTQAQANAAVKILKDATNKALGVTTPLPSTDEEAHWYVISSLRGSRVLTSQNNLAIGLNITVNPKFTAGHDVWKLVEREDATYDIVNMLGEYVNADNVANNTGMNISTEAPKGGWDIAASNYEAGSFVIYSDAAGNAQWNQSGNGNFPVLNWHPADTYPILTDEGSSFTFMEYSGELVEHVHSGWYRMAVESGNIPDAGKNILNADSEWRQNNTNFYALLYGTPSESYPAKEYIRLTIDGSCHSFTSLNGHGIKENCTSDRNSVSDDNPVLGIQENGFYSVAKWNNAPGRDAWAGKTYVGKSSNSNNTFSLTPVSDEELEAYDIWTVDITALPHEEVGKDVSVTLDNPSNKGITTVFNGGTYFLTKGAEITEDQLTFTTLNAQELENPFIHINDVDKIIRIDFTDPNPDIPVSSVELDEGSLEMEVGETKTLKATINPSDATEQDVTWTSSDESVATVDSEGNVTAVGEGTATITATCTDQSAECVVTVGPAAPVVIPVTGITISDESVTLKVGDSKQLTATVTPDDATEQEITWASSNALVASVDSEGNVTALAVGNTVISATCGEQSAECAVVVEAKEEENPGDEDGISEINIDSSIKVYDLQGRRVANPSSGLYIVGNKLVRK